jgi:hypothetical protein
VFLVKSKDRIGVSFWFEDKAFSVPGLCFFSGVRTELRFEDKAFSVPGLCFLSGVRTELITASGLRTKPLVYLVCVSCQE